MSTIFSLSTVDSMSKCDHIWARVRHWRCISFRLYWVEAMSDDCTVDFLPGAMRDLDRIARRDPVRLPILEQKVAQVEEDGWILSTRSELIKVLRSETCVGEIRDLGRGGYRLFFFWTDGGDGRDLHVTHIRAKSQVTGRARLSETLDAVERLRDRYLNEK